MSTVLSVLLQRLLCCWAATLASVSYCHVDCIVVFRCLPCCRLPMSTVLSSSDVYRVVVFRCLPYYPTAMLILLFCSDTYSALLYWSATIFDVRCVSLTITMLHCYGIPDCINESYCIVCTFLVRNCSMCLHGNLLANSILPRTPAGINHLGYSDVCCMAYILPLAYIPFPEHPIFKTLYRAIGRSQFQSALSQ